MLGELLVKVEDGLEPELKKFLEVVIENLEKIPTDKISFEMTYEGEYYNIFGKKAKRKISDIDCVKYKDSLIRYSIDVYYPERIDSPEWTERHRKELFFVISFTKDNNYSIVVSSSDTKHFANYEVAVYMLRTEPYTICVGGKHPLYSKIAHYNLSALTALKEFQFVDKLMEKVKSLVKNHVKFKDNVSSSKEEFLSIISDVINTGNTE